MTPPLHLPQKETQRSRLHPAEPSARGRAEVLSRGCSLLVCHQTCLCVWVATPPHSRQASHVEDSSLLREDSSFALFRRTKAGQDSGAAVQSPSTQMFCDKGAGCLRHGGKNVPT